MQIKVKETKELKKGTGKKGDWTLTLVKSDDGKDYKTFDKRAVSLAPGTALEIGEPKDDGTFETLSIISKPVATAPSPASKPMTPKDWADKDTQQRVSIEGQCAMKCWTELEVAGIPIGNISELLREAIESKIRGFMGDEVVTDHIEREITIVEPLLTIPQLNKIISLAKEKGYSNELAIAIMLRLYHKGATKALTQKEAEDFIEKLGAGYMLDQTPDKLGEPPIEE